jgi:cell division transport system permease protein
MRFGFFLREALRALRRNAVPSFAAMATVLVTVLVLGVFIPVVQATTSGANEIRAKVVADVYLKSGVTKQDIERVRQILANDTPGVGRVQFISKEQAYAEEKKRNPEAYALLGSNPLPDTFRVTPAKPDDIVKVRSRPCRRRAPARWSTARSTRCATGRRTRTRSCPPRAS